MIDIINEVIKEMEERLYSQDEFESDSFKNKVIKQFLNKSKKNTFYLTDYNSDYLIAFNIADKLEKNNLKANLISIVYDKNEFDEDFFTFKFSVKSRGRGASIVSISTKYVDNMFLPDEATEGMSGYSLVCNVKIDYMDFSSDYEIAEYSRKVFYTDESFVQYQLTKYFDNNVYLDFRDNNYNSISEYVLDIVKTLH